MNVSSLFTRFLFLCLILTFTLGCTATAAIPIDSSDSIYSYKKPSSDGIGKVYYGREIASVMGYRGANWLSRPSRLSEERSDMAVDALMLERDDVVADIGAGLGYISFQLAKWVDQGKVIAVDVQPEMLALLEAERDQYDVKNIETVLSTESDPNLPAESIDMAVMFDAYHEFAYPKEMMTGIAKALKPKGQVVLAEYRAENPLVLIKKHHKMTQKQVKKEMRAVGLKWVNTDNRLPQQHLMFFEKAVDELR
ncbi:Methyltransferase domain family [Synechococcus sp. PCC 7335]|uniref:class I SAM-dependent methyltransferase n=1 Tax=Synechococcus sp. (strain ATCC 29403 / PCC 7335) TaxID=91464 RepID=UPI00017EBFEF|nr:class I SAM-dependent methyltransferase [Synechococcus sp. PCC 7335]EDX85028.1 Methyltransferase domain family [Synechococcus sp. PCC 7335]